MGTGKKVQILLSTYNGEKYLREQLDSFAEQTVFQNISVLIRDDGSTDGTVTILQEYEKKYGFCVEYGFNIGTTRSYLWLLEHSDDSCDFFAFSDQDDVWLPEKIEKEAAEMQRMDSTRPRLVSTHSEIVNKNLSHQGSSIPIKKGVSFFNAMVQNVCPGHTQLLDRKLRDAVRKTAEPSAVLVVDWWVYLIASGLGTVEALPEVTVLHRQHGNNTIGYATSPVFQFVTRLRRLHGKTAAAMTRQLKAFYRCYGCQIADDYRAELESFLNSLPSLRHRLHYVVSAKIFRQSAMDTMAVKILYVLGKYCERNS